MQRTSLLSLVLVGLVVVAGCNAFSSGSNTPLVTPMDVPTDTPPPTVAPADSRLPQQCRPIQQIGVENAAALAAAHNSSGASTAQFSGLKANVPSPKITSSVPVSVSRMNIRPDAVTRTATSDAGTTASQMGTRLPPSAQYSPSVPYSSD
jgi:hypothetical protein